MKKLYTLLLLCSACIAVKAQGFLGFGAGTNKFKSAIVNLQVGYQLNHVVSEFEMKAPPIDTRVADPAVFSFKTGYEITLAGNLVFVPQIEASYMQYSADESKTIEWKNGWKAGVSGRLRWGHIFVQGDYAGGSTYLCAGICAQFKKQQSW